MNTKGIINLNRSIIGGHDDHGSVLQLLLLFLLLFSNHGGFQIAAGQATPGGSDVTGDSSRFDPTMAILMIILVSIFFFLGFFSVYIRRCLERVMGMDYGNSDDAANWLTLNRQPARGLDASVIETFPTFQYSTVKTLRIGKEALECPVCLNEFEDDETLRLIPKCCHVFHPGCIDAWLRSHATCPLCRADLIPVPGESIIQIPDLTNDPAGSDPTGDRIRVLGSPDARLLDSVALTCNQSMPRRSMSTGWSLAGIFTNPDWTGQHLQNLDRFTLKLPQDIHNKILHPSLSKGHAALPQVMSSARGYRTGSLGSERNYFYERFDHQDGRLDRRPFSITPPYRTGSINNSTSPPDGSSDQVHAGSPKSLLLAMKSPFDRLFLGKNNNNNNVGERSSDHLRSGDATPSHTV
ncbi:PREDICTED: RING-H2 finger protein ATL11-like isoform X2 [Camelina sativa]|uniref:RING-type E3 ubiquitin transferase n=1 Tax=Camelina sativa TaxID=90675 RepID=A0ABM0SQW9_CAMSA|nr:PREDICTED: RING-H2 finger protein ATL11-like isoform X3 [Camelina sativa]XP_019083171.1 PREDICTED: RING-H2 finger protein ATL11-like isoform X1 [Camelina sativa]XP_019083172.1 PREDICTED: RING-H2 finger protein ATL11-like isoform X2 [Camelina sativa]